jgi:hypothetical protein
MYLRDILKEKFLISEFKFGFELEAFYKNASNSSKEDAYRDIISLVSDYYTDLGRIEGDASLKADDIDDTPFEWASPVMNFTPHNVKNTIDFLSRLGGKGIYTNSSCGFHVHLSFPYISEQDLAWILCHLSLSPDMANKITKFKNYSFYNNLHANPGFLIKIANALVDQDWMSLQDLFNNEKYRLFRIHPQGTLEWRGPRDFLSDNNRETIVDFFKLLRDFVVWIANMLSLDSIDIGGNVFDKKTIIQYISPRRVFLPRDSRWGVDQDLELIPLLRVQYPWLFKAKFHHAVVEIKNNKLFWVSGEWIDGEWLDGTWVDGKWKNGTWKNGEWYFGEWFDGTWENGIWYSGYWDQGKWLNGTWHKGKWIDGVWQNGTWLEGEWLGGVWKFGVWKAGTWKNGMWYDGIWQNGNWQDGTWFRGRWIGGKINNMPSNKPPRR